MQISPTYRAILSACPDLGLIFKFVPEMGRSGCSWIHAITKTGQRVSRFLKKGLIRFNAWLNNSEYFSLNQKRIYQVSQESCTCPDWKYRVSKGKGYKKGVGKVNQCKHQMAQLFYQTCDISHFSESIESQKVQPKTQVDCVNVPDKISILSHGDWGDFQTFDVYYDSKLIGEIEATQNGFEAATFKGFRHTFTTQESAINYLLKQSKLSEKEQDEIIQKEAEQAMKDLFGDDVFKPNTWSNIFDEF